MFRKNIIYAFRNILRNKINTSINIIGLSLGMAASFLILLYVINEFSYEKVHKNRENIYRILNYSIDGSHDNIGVTQSSKLVPTTKSDIPEIIAATRMNMLEERPFFVKSEGDFERETGRRYWVDEDFFKIFTFTIKHGNPDKLFNGPSSVIITEEISSKYFGESNPLGENLDILIYSDIKTYTISGVIKSSPDNTVIKPDFIFDIKPDIPDFYQAPKKSKNNEITTLKRNYFEHIILMKLISKNGQFNINYYLRSRGFVMT